MVECLTDNVKRTAPEMRVLFRKGQLGASGSVAWDFDHVGMIEAETRQPAGRRPRIGRHRGRRPGFGAGRRGATPCFSPSPTELDLVSRALPGSRLHRVVMPSWATSPKTRWTLPACSAEALEEVEAFSGRH
jgi:hypothetical protein